MSAFDWIYLIGANGAKPKQAAWVDNIVANGDARVVLCRSEKLMRARLVDPASAERERV